MINSKEHIRLLLTGGGTGGHLFPALAAAQMFRKKLKSPEILFVGTQRKVDSRSLAQYGFENKNIQSYGFKGKSVKDLIKASFFLPVSFYQARKIIKQFQPHLILGVGGYVTVPVILAGKVSKIPTVIHEQNSVAGLANRKLAKIVDKICLSLPGSGNAFDAGKVVYTGNPVRESILEASKQRTASGDKKTLLILGGSQGAEAVNTLVTEAIISLDKEFLSTLRVIHQTGERQEEMVRDVYHKHDIDALVQSFFTEMDKIYSKADLLVSRAGATTLAEISVLGKPAILIPYPYAADNHQEKNAKHYVDKLGALIFNQKEIFPEKMGQAIKELLSNETRLAAMGENMKKLSYPDAAGKIVHCCLAEIQTHYG